MVTFSVYHRAGFGWAHSSIGARRFVSLNSAIASAERWERGAFQIRAIDERGNQAIVHEQG